MTRSFGSLSFASSFKPAFERKAIISKLLSEVGSRKYEDSEIERQKWEVPSPITRELFFFFGFVSSQIEHDESSGNFRGQDFSKKKFMNYTNEFFIIAQIFRCIFFGDNSMQSKKIRVFAASVFA